VSVAMGGSCMVFHFFIFFSWEWTLGGKCGWGGGDQLEKKRSGVFSVASL
jgi:hypothetical protein